MRYVMMGGLATEELGDDLLLCDPAGSTVHCLSGEGRRYFESLSSGAAELPDDEVTAALVASGAIAPVETGVSRRQAIAMGAAAAAAVGVVTVGLPSAAAAQSPTEGSDYLPSDPNNIPVAPSSGTAPAGDDELWSISTTATVFQGNRRARAEWYTGLNEDPVTFSWYLYSPGGFNVSSQFTASGTSTGSTGNILVPGAQLDQTYIFVATSVGGTVQIFTGTFNL